LPFWVHFAMRRPHAHSAAETSIIIGHGMGARAIVEALADNNVITDRYVVLLWLPTSRSRLKSGEYRFQSPITPLEAITKIARGEVVTHRVTIPEGFNRFDIAALLASKTGQADEAEFEALTADPHLIADLDPGATDLEGYLFPDTYTYSLDTTPADLIKQMTERCRAVLSPAIMQRAAEMNLTIRQVMTMASIIEKEAKNDDERPIIASVFYNRLKVNMLLATDPTFVYAAILAHDYDGNVNNPRHRARNSPYNTYLKPGLPPGPIASPGRKSIEAVLNPATTNYYYFVATGTDGSHHFSHSLDEHERYVAQYRHQLQLLRQRQAQVAN